jgi:hypothetical protein
MAIKKRIGVKRAGILWLNILGYLEDSYRRKRSEAARRIPDLTWKGTGGKPGPTVKEILEKVDKRDISVNDGCKIISKVEAYYNRKIEEEGRRLELEQQPILSFSDKEVQDIKEDTLT